MKRSTELGLKVVLLGALCLWGAMSLTWPHGRDQGIFAWVGNVILDGGAPYKDAWEVKGPMTHLCFALSQALFGHNEWGIRLFDFALLVASLVAAVRLTKRVAGTVAGWCAAIVFFGLYVADGPWTTAQPDGWCAMILIIVLAVAAREDFSARVLWQVGAGLLLGVLSLFKPPFAAFIMPVAILVLMRSGWRWPRALRPLVVLGLSALLPVAGVALWLASRHALGAFVEIQFTFNPSVHAASHHNTITNHINGLVRFVYENALISVCVPVCALGMVVALARDRALGVVLVTSLGLAVVSVAAQIKYYTYHWHSVSAIFALFSGVGMAALAELWRGAGRSSNDERVTRVRLGVLVWTSIVLIVALCVRTPARDTLRWCARVAGVRSWRVVHPGFYPYGEGDVSHLADQEVAAYLSAHTSSQDTVLVWGFEPLINYLARRRCPTRFGFNYALTRGEGNPFEAQYRRELLDALAKSPPQYLVVVDHDENNLMPKSSKAFLSEFAALKKFLHANYRVETVIEHFELWRLTEDATPHGGSRPPDRGQTP